MSDAPAAFHLSVTYYHYYFRFLFNHQTGRFFQKLLWVRPSPLMSKNLFVGLLVEQESFYRPDALVVVQPAVSKHCTG